MVGTGRILHLRAGRAHVDIAFRMGSASRGARCRDENTHRTPARGRGSRDRSDLLPPPAPQPPHPTASSRSAGTRGLRAPAANPYFPLRPGTTTILRGTDEGERLRERVARHLPDQDDPGRADPRGHATSCVAPTGRSPRRRPTGTPPTTPATSGTSARPPRRTTRRGTSSPARAPGRPAATAPCAGDDHARAPARDPGVPPGVLPRPRRGPGLDRRPLRPHDDTAEDLPPRGAQLRVDPPRAGRDLARSSTPPVSGS